MTRPKRCAALKTAAIAICHISEPGPNDRQITQTTFWTAAYSFDMGCTLMYALLIDLIPHKN